MSVQMVDVFQFLDIIHLNCIWNAEVRSRMGWLAGGLGKTTVGGEGGGGHCCCSGPHPDFKRGWLVCYRSNYVHFVPDW